MESFVYAPPGGFVGFGSYVEDVTIQPAAGSLALSGGVAPVVLTSVFAETTFLWDIEASVTGLFTFVWNVTPTLDVLNTGLLMPHLLTKNDSTWLDVNTLFHMNGRTCLLPDVQAVNNSLRNLLRCPLGDRGRIRRPDYGTYLWHMLQEPMDQTSANQIRATLIQSIEVWEPRIKINYPGTYVKADLNNALYYVHIEYTYLLTSEMQATTFSVSQRAG